MTLNFTVNGVKQNINPQGGNYSLNYPCSSKTTCYPYESDFPPGNYSFIVYGAGGGCPTNGYDSPGGFSTGVLVLKQKTRLYFYVGAKGLCDAPSGGKNSPVFGGGGSGHNHPGIECYGCSGGGASDIRVLQNTLNHRVIVAGGAGGSGYYDNKYMFGGKGGGTSGTKGEDYNSINIGGGPGNQTSGGSSGHQVGIFGYGGNRTTANGGGGGGGWYGGGAAGPSGGCFCAAGGSGSGFIFTQLNPLVSLNSSFLLLSGKTETNTGNNIGDGRVIIEVLEIIIQKTKIHGTCNYRNVFILPLLLFWPYIMS